MSIQLSLDGHSFSTTGLDASFPKGEPVPVEVLSLRTLLVPEEFFEAANAFELLAAAGLTPTQDESAVWGYPHSGIVALMTAHKEAIRAVEQTIGEDAYYTTPLLSMAATTGIPTIALHYQAGLLYIKVSDATKAMLLAEIIPAADEADILLLADRLDREFPLKNHQGVASGDTQTLRRLVGKQFKIFVCV